MRKSFIRSFLICLLSWTGMPVRAQDARDMRDMRDIRDTRDTRDTLGVNLLLQMSDRCFLKPGRQAIDLDSAEYYARSAETISNRLAYQRGIGNSYEQISKILHVRGDVAGGRSYADKAIGIFKTNHYLTELGYAYYDRSGYYSIYDSSINERIRIQEQALLAFQQAQDRRKEADMHKELGDLRQLKGDFYASLSDLKQALQLFQSIGYRNLEGTYDLMGTVSTMLDDYEQALQYGLLAIKTAEEMKDSTEQLATIYNRVALTYETMKKFKPAYECYQRSLEIAQRCKDTPTILNLISNISQLLVSSHKPREALSLLKSISGRYAIRDSMQQLLVTARFLFAYTELKQYDKAQLYSDHLLKLIDVVRPNGPRSLVLYHILIRFLTASHQNVQARKYLAIYEKLGEQLHSPRTASLVHMFWFKLDSLQGNYQAAIFHYERYQTINDSILNEKAKGHTEQLRLAFETEKKDKDILLQQKNIELLTKQAELQQSQLKQARLTSYITLGGTLLLVIALVLLYMYLQNRIRSHRKLQIQQKEIEDKNSSLQHLVGEKEWLIKEIHHRVKNNLHMVNGLLGTQLGYLKSEEALGALGESQRRVQAMALIHQKLYQSENLSAINMADYIHELVDYLQESFSISKNIQFKLQVDPIESDLKHCIPLGLILNEAITNAIKYAFGPGQRGVISVGLTYDGPKRLLLIIADNGAGLPAGFDIHTRKSMGMNLMQGLSEDIEGEFSISSRQGTEIRVAFYYDPESAPEAGPVNFETSIV